MFRWKSIVGGLLIMMGHHARSEALFYYFRLEDQIPETHLLRLIDKHISFEFVREQLKASYSEVGATVDRSRTPAAHAADRLSVRHHQRTQTGGRTAHASGMALVHGARIRPGDSPSFNLLQEPSRTLSGGEAVRAVVRASGATVCEGGTGRGQAPVGGW